MQTLSSDILHEVMLFLQRPLPLPQTYYEDHGCVKQPELRACLRVCRDFYNIAAPLLYRHAVTDDFAAFLFISPGPAIPGIIPKQALLGHTQRLFIEYDRKGEWDEDEWTECGRWTSDSLQQSLGDAAEDYMEGRLGWAQQFGWEVKQLSEALARFTGWPNFRTSPRFTSLESVAVGAFFGSDEENAQLELGETEEWEDYGRLVRETQAAFRQLLAGCPVLQHYCQRPISGPLSFGETIQLPIKGDNRPSATLHAHSICDITPHTAIGIPLRWYFHSAQWGGATSDSFASYLAADVNNLSMSRDFLARRHATKSATWDMDVTIYRAHPPWVNDDPDLYGPGCAKRPHPKSENDKEVWREETEDLQAAMRRGVKQRRKALPAGVAPVDKWNYRQIFDAPPCEACGWVYKREPSPAELEEIHEKEYQAWVQEHGGSHDGIMPSDVSGLSGP